MEGQLTLSELNFLVKESIQSTFPEQVWVVAEISEMKVNRNGHCFLELVEKNKVTDEISAKARATIWSWQFRFIQPYFETTTGQALTAGLKVLVSVSVEFHEVYGYSLKIMDIDPAYTLGDIAKRRLEIVMRLKEEGVINMNKGIDFPDIPSRIAVISSPNAAGYEDFVIQLFNNKSGYKFYIHLFPAVMQGNDAAFSIIDALNKVFVLDKYFDIVVIIRGGGSHLDLSCFDDFDLALNIAQFPLPVITGIGHEKDESIADIVAHMKLKTPTAVAEFLIGKFDEAASEIDYLESTFVNYMTQLLKEEINRVDNNARFLKTLVKSQLEINKLNMQHLIAYVKPSVNQIIERKSYRLNHLNNYMITYSNNYLKRKEINLNHIVSELTLRNKFIFEKEMNKLKLFEKSIDLYNPSNILKRGYSITLKCSRVINSSSELTGGDILKTIFYDGEVLSIVKGEN